MSDFLFLPGSVSWFFEAFLRKFLALLGGLLGTIGGLVFLCSRGNDEEDDGDYHPQYSAPQSHKGSNKRQPSYL
jgi:hypothetical protein